jgi:hypothetical protein
MSKGRPKKRYKIVRTQVVASGKMDKETQEKVAGAVGTVAGLLFAGGLAMIPINAILGCIIAGTGAALGWFVLIWRGWFACLNRKCAQYLGFGIIIVAFTVLALCIPGSKSDDASGNTAIPQSITANAPNSPGSQVVAIGQVYGGLYMDRSDPNGMAEVNRKLDALLEITGTEIHRLEKEYDLGFVLVAFSGEVDATRVIPHTNRIEADWNQCRASGGEDGRMRVRMPPVIILTGPRGRLRLKFYDVYFSIDAKPGAKSFSLFEPSGIRARLECLKTEPIGICAVVGFAESKGEKPKE